MPLEKVWQSQNVPFNKFKCAGKSLKHIYPKHGWKNTDVFLKIQLQAFFRKYNKNSIVFLKTSIKNGFSSAQKSDIFKQNCKIHQITQKIHHLSLEVYFQKNALHRHSIASALKFLQFRKAALVFFPIRLIVRCTFRFFAFDIDIMFVIT